MKPQPSLLGRLAGRAIHRLVDALAPEPSPDDPLEERSTGTPNTVTFDPSGHDVDDTEVRETVDMRASATTSLGHDDSLDPKKIKLITGTLLELRSGINRILADPELDARTELAKLVALDHRVTGRRRRAPKHTGCTVPGCPEAHRARGYCAAHYQQWKRGTLGVAS